MSSVRTSRTANTPTTTTTSKHHHHHRSVPSRLDPLDVASPNNTTKTTSTPSMPKLPIVNPSPTKLMASTTSSAATCHHLSPVAVASRMIPMAKRPKQTDGVGDFCVSSPMAAGGKVGDRYVHVFSRDYSPPRTPPLFRTEEEAREYEHNKMSPWDKSSSWRTQKGTSAEDVKKLTPESYHPQTAEERFDKFRRAIATAGPPRNVQDYTGRILHRVFTGQVLKTT
eukprot:PhM_4_TR18027/c10_g2_i2/m.93113